MPQSHSVPHASWERFIGGGIYKRLSLSEQTVKAQALLRVQCSHPGEIHDGGNVLRLVAGDDMFTGTESLKVAGRALGSGMWRFLVFQHLLPMRTRERHQPV